MGSGFEVLRFGAYTNLHTSPSTYCPQSPPHFRGTLCIPEAHSGALPHRFRGWHQSPQEPHLLTLCKLRGISLPQKDALVVHVPSSDALPCAGKAGAERAPSLNLSVWAYSTPSHHPLCRSLDFSKLSPVSEMGCHEDQMRSMCILNEIGRLHSFIFYNSIHKLIFFINKHKVC